MKNSTIEEIVIIDDDIKSAQKCKFIAEDLDFKTRLITDGSHKSVQQLLERILVDTKNIGVLCDHRLMYHNGFANFYGSELVAALYHHKVPGILLTQYGDSDIDTSIRQYRRWNPVMIPRDEISMENIPKALNFCEQELSGIVPASRKPYRTMVEITRCTSDDGHDIAEAFVPGWNASHMVRFPLSLMDEGTIMKTQLTVQKGDFAYLFAQVNIGAANSGELFFDHFEWAGEPQTSSLDSLFNR
jgi:hypothetical protein